MNKRKKMIEECIMTAIADLSNRICRNTNEDENAISANSIKVLSEAYDIVHRGKRGDH